MADGQLLFQGRQPILKQLNVGLIF